MYQFHGCFWLDHSADGAGGEPLDAGLAALRLLLDELGEHVPVRELRPLNGQYVLLVAGAGNRPRDTPPRLARLLDQVAATLPGSHGLLYERDDEAVADGLSNAYRVRRIVRGVVSEERDPYFSPIIPTVED